MWIQWEMYVYNAVFVLYCCSFVHTCKFQVYNTCIFIMFVIVVRIIDELYKVNGYQNPLYGMSGISVRGVMDYSLPRCFAVCWLNMSGCFCVVYICFEQLPSRRMAVRKIVKKFIRTRWTLNTGDRSKQWIQHMKGYGDAVNLPGPRVWWVKS